MQLIAGNAHAILFTNTRAELHRAVVHRSRPRCLAPHHGSLDTSRQAAGRACATQGALCGRHPA
jgi:hypothetical protein